MVARIKRQWKSRYYFGQTNKSKRKFTIGQKVHPPAYNGACHTQAHDKNKSARNEIFKFGDL